MDHLETRNTELERKVVAQQDIMDSQGGGSKANVDVDMLESQLEAQRELIEKLRDNLSSVKGGDVGGAAADLIKSQQSDVVELERDKAGTNSGEELNHVSHDDTHAAHQFYRSQFHRTLMDMGDMIVFHSPW